MKLIRVLVMVAATTPIDGLSAAVVRQRVLIGAPLRGFDLLAARIVVIILGLILERDQARLLVQPLLYE